MGSSYNSETTADELVQDLAAAIKGKSILTTGVSPGGLGAAFVESIAAAQPSLLILAGRTVAKIQETAETIKAKYPGVDVRLLELDLSSFAAVRKAADAVLGWDDVPKIDVLVNNAGVMGIEWAQSVDGFEMTFVVNHLGHFLFTNLIMSKILASEAPRVVNVSSEGHRFNPIRWGDYNFHDGDTYNKWQAYGQAKTANMLMALSLAKKLGETHGLLAFSLHPGFVFTHLSDHMNWWEEQSAIQAVDVALGNVEDQIAFKTAQHGAATHIFASFAPGLEAYNGAYLTGCHVADPFTETVKPWGTSVVEAERLWQLSEKLVGQEFTY
ncbi:uncharacterized protein Aud_001774 [Aspergillus udagawae]|uniref:WW domain-containing oxidoreductase n=1 Tax=Aspergillus udagawae TaxID=91492 RepID=A0A8E0UU46_9EURO|nr:uncharacterized protein Aud_001774 [Aspergillus udagawae]GIC85932.1 hypothetical protein Aud_001774 [Aspergillus udagawae]